MLSFCCRLGHSTCLRFWRFHVASLEVSVCSGAAGKIFVSATVSQALWGLGWFGDYAAAYSD